MKLNHLSSLVIVFCLLSCLMKQEDSGQVYTGPKVVGAKGYVVPQDSMAEPKVIPIDESKLKKIPASNPKVVPTNTNVHLAGTPKVVIAGTPRVCIPGQDSFLLPKTVPAIDSPFIAGIPEVVPAKDPSIKDQNPHNFSSFGKLQGLKHGTTGYIIQDQNGNLWFATYGGGVSRFDGKSFTNFTTNEGLSNNSVLCIKEDHVGNLWFGTERGGINKYDGKSFTHFTTSEGLPNNTVWSILEDKTGNLWFATYGGGVCRYDGKTLTNFTTHQGLSNNSVLSIIEDHDGNLWFGTDGGGVSRYDGKSFTHFTTSEGLANNSVHSILEDQEGNLWFGTDGGVNRYDGKSFTHFTTSEGLSDNFVYSILEDQAGNLWFCTGLGGVNRYDGKSFTHFTTSEGLANNNVWSILEDQAGNLWIGTFDGGVSRYDGNAFTHFTTSEGLANNSIRSILEDHEGNLWFATNGGGVNRYDGNSFTHFTTSEGIDNNHVYSILEDKTGHLWFGIGNGVVSRYDGKSFINFPLSEGINNNYVFSILEDRAGNLWFATQSHGVIKYDGKSFTHFTTSEGLSNNTVLSILEDRAGNLWFATNGGGANRYDGKTFTHFTTSEGLSNNYVTSILEDQTGNLWFGTNGGGVNRYDGKTFTHFTTSEGLTDNSIFSILEDKTGNLWFGTAFGLNKLPKKYASSISNETSTASVTNVDVLFKNYSYEDGFLGIGCNRNGLFEDRTGTIWIGANDRLTAYHPGGDIPDTIPPNIQLTGISIFNEKIPWPHLQNHLDSTLILGNGIKVGNMEFDSTSNWYGLPINLTLAYNNNSLTFNFVGITQKSPKKVKYRYTLEGNDENWSSLTHQTEAHFGNLSHGHYTFKVKAMNSEGYWSDEFHYPFTIRPPWWLTGWAYSLYALGIITMFWQLHKYQQARTIRIERERTQAKELEQAKEIEKAYNQLETAHENLKSTQKQLIQSEKMASLGQLTAGIAHEIQNPLNFVNNFSDINNELIDELTEEVDKGNLDEVKAIARDLKENEQKINHHGKRADTIVKGMLQHSRASSGVKEPTNINVLADEYLRLAYHGLRAKDKTFNATMKTDFDTGIGLVNIVPQDIGRVILNLITNAFYAVSAPKPPKGGLPYEPTVTISTRKISHTPPHSNTHRIGDLGANRSTGDLGVTISVSDNGPGIPDLIRDKIFQPFFTTKPTGQGTGLGLSISYDIIKAHGGELKVESNEGEGSVFIIILPIA